MDNFNMSKKKMMKNPSGIIEESIHVHQLIKGKINSRIFLLQWYNKDKNYIIKNQNLF
jgi:hypothetical protein